MARETKRQLEVRKQYDNPRIGMCDVPHCKTLQPQKGRYHGLCWFHFRMIGHWAEKVGHDLAWSGSPFDDQYHEKRLAAIGAYREWLGEKASSRSR